MHNSTHPDADRNYYNNVHNPQNFPNIINNMVPNNLHTLIGPRLPNLVYYFLSVGLVSPQVINNVVHNTMVEYLPTVDSFEYRELLQKIVPLRTQIAYLLINCMSRKDEQYWKVAAHGGNRLIMSYVQWHTDKTIALHNPPELLLDDWDLTWQTLKLELPQDDKKSYVMNFVTVLPFAKCALKAMPGAPPVQVYSQMGEVVCVILLKSLDLLGYFTHPPMQKPVGNEESGTSLFADALYDLNWRFAEQGVVFIELLRTGALTASPLQNACGAEEISVVADPNILLLTRVLSILPMNLKSETWGNESLVVRDLCAFHVLFKSLYKTLRNLCEIIMTVMFMDNRVRLRDMNEMPSIFNELGDRLPFNENTNTAMGIVVHYLLTTPRPPNWERMSPSDRWKALRVEESFPCCQDVRGDLARGYAFWNEATKVVGKLEKGGAMSRPLSAQFPGATNLFEATMASFDIKPDALRETFPARQW
eukprot:NODE_257_length_2817_cov_109.691537_g241_i0.p1 GENE.NODE_257_length_2817_cov_109.691537_g241_i0~~NODE_257_length_2817_cov_109.691537_g241_i0.p1  ORF type:complete len:477 (-),score=65.97 NODE_257_length_2817_cov_109.691537_g241_i0:238-1668(-)